LARKDRVPGLSIDTRKMPPVEAIENEPIRTALEAYNAALVAQRDARQSFEQLNTLRALEAAKAADACAVADAISDGKKPAAADQHVKAHARKLTEAEVHRDATKLLAERRLRELDEAVVEHCDEWREQIDGGQGKAYARYHAAVNELEPAVTELNKLGALHAFLNGRMYRPGRSYGTHVILRDVNGHEEPHNVAEVIATLRTLGYPILSPAQQRAELAALAAADRATVSRRQ
jgi:hypothetical protein